MLFKDKLLKFFQNSYRQNTKFNHAYLGYLQIFFERGNKFKSSFTALGNTFRNSKWSDLKVTNIKSSFTKTWLRIIVTMLLTLYIIFFLWATLLNEGIEVLTFDGFRIFMGSAFAGLYRLTTMPWSYSKRKAVYEEVLSHDTSTTQDYATKKTSKKYQPTLQSSSVDRQKSDAVASVVHSAIAASQSIKTLDSPTVKDLMEWVEPVTNFDSESYVKYGIVPDLVSYKSPKAAFFISRNSKNGIATRFNNIDSQWLNTPGSVYWLYSPSLSSGSITLAMFNKLSDSNPALTTNSLNIKSNIDAFKQDRWLMKNTLLSNNNLVKTFNLTQAKKLIGSNLSQSNASASNIWVSNSVNNSKLASKMYQHLYSNPHNYDFIQNQGVYTPALENINFQENSFFWLLQKYTFSNQLRFNTLVYSNSTSTSIPNVVPTDSQSLYKLAIQLQQTSLSPKYTPLAIQELYNNYDFDLETTPLSLGNFSLLNTDLDSLLPASSTLAEKISSTSLSSNSNITTHPLGLLTLNSKSSGIKFS